MQKGKIENIAEDIKILSVTANWDRFCVIETNLWSNFHTGRKLGAGRHFNNEHRKAACTDNWALFKCCSSLIRFILARILAVALIK